MAPNEELLDAALFGTMHVGQKSRFAALITSSDTALDRYGRMYLTLSLRCTDGIVLTGRWWNCPLLPHQHPAVGKVYVCEAALDVYQGERQLRIVQMEAAPGIDVLCFARATRRSLAELQSLLANMIAGVRPPLKALLKEVLSGEIYRRYCEYPIAPERARYFDHISLGAMMVKSAAERAEPRLSLEEREALLHAMLAHHGQLTWGSPVVPQTAEAWVVHVADYGESRLWAWTNEEAEQFSAPHSNLPVASLPNGPGVLCSPPTAVILDEQATGDDVTGRYLHER
jgi:23S rRNA maturation-related 3'-5' exoribonuclease YhaM